VINSTQKPGDNRDNDEDQDSLVSDKWTIKGPVATALRRVNLNFITDHKEEKTSLS